MIPQHHGAERAGQEHRVITRLASFAALSDDELALLAAMAGPPHQLTRGASIRAEDGRATALHLLVDGWAASAVGLADGSRQLNALCLPGDMLGLPSLALAEPFDEVVALSTVIVLPIAVEKLARLFFESPRLAALLFLVSQEERALAMERLALIGQAPARARLAALFLRLGERMALLQEDSCRFALPLTQKDVGDLIGVTAVHVNATLKSLKEERVIALDRRELHILDRDRLCAIANRPAWRRAQPTWLPPSNAGSDAGQAD